MIFPNIFLAITLLIVLISSGYNASQNNPPQSVTRLARTSSQLDSKFCEQNRTKGIYSLPQPRWLDSVKCCKGKFLMDSFWLPKIIKGHAPYMPNWVWCDRNITRDNDNDDVPTLMWKIHACKVKSFLGKEEGDIDYGTYVKLRLSNYTEENNVRKLIQDGNKKCPEAEKETLFHKKILQYFSCFAKNSKKICHETTPELERRLQITIKQEEKAYNRTLNFKCPGLREGWNHNEFCCNGEIIPHPWITWLMGSAELPNPFQKFPNGTWLVDKTYQDCMITSYNAQLNISTSTIQTVITIKTPAQRELYGSCKAACSLNPVKFLDDGTSEPKMKFDFNKTLDKFLSNFNKPVKTTVFQAFIKGNTRIYWHLNKAKEETVIKFDDVGSAYSKIKSLPEKATFYCMYYDNFVEIAKHSLYGCCR